MFERLSRAGVCGLACAAVIVLAGCEDEGESLPDETAGVFETPVLLTAGGELPGAAGTTVVDVRALAVNDNKVAAVEADTDSPGTALLLTKDGEQGAQPTVVVIIKTDDALPDGAGVFESVVPEVHFINENVYVDSLDRVVFMAQDSGGNVLGIFRAGLDGVVETLVAVGDAADGDTIATIAPNLAASPSGLVAFVAALDSSGLNVVLFRDDAGTIHTVASEDDYLPGGSTAFFDGGFSDVFVNDKGRVAFRATSLNAWHTWHWDEGAAELTVLTCLGHPMPGLPPTPAVTIVVTTTEGIHADGRALVTSTPSDGLAIYLHRFTSAISSDTVLVAGTRAPSGLWWVGVWLGDVRSVPSGWVSCVGVEAGTNALVLFRQKKGVATEVARLQQIIPGTSPEATITGIPRHRLGDSRKIVYLADTDQGDMLCRMNAAGETAVIAYIGMAVPGSATATITAIDRASFFVNGTGGVVYTATTDDGGTVATAVLTGE